MMHIACLAPQSAVLCSSRHRHSCHRASGSACHWLAASSDPQHPRLPTHILGGALLNTETERPKHAREGKKRIIAPSGAASEYYPHTIEVSTVAEPLTPFLSYLRLYAQNNAGTASSSLNTQYPSRLCCP
ncbi:hypothetical protein FIBSPDRAFT_372681 [Athelia psychrophila]|uniref:Uncharacterized protein n=1 Tax=Athelia psychrophila TaxID=1759441 RepID=A0A166VVQ4_9AGAM|nr:hypothetical protein FIBSPDRAFT_372681 [Fibularhizoctonia sp. CBS 109695]